MKPNAWKHYARLLRSTQGEEAQDLVEYALVVALIACAVVGGVQSVALNLSTAFSNISTNVSSLTTN